MSHSSYIFLGILKRKFYSFAILYFCLGRFISPIVGEISKKYPNVTTYKIDIDQVWNRIVRNNVWLGILNHIMV